MGNGSLQSSAADQPMTAPWQIYELRFNLGGETCRFLQGSEYVGIASDYQSRGLIGFKFDHAVGYFHRCGGIDSDQCFDKRFTLKWFGVRDQLEYSAPNRECGRVGAPKCPPLAAPA